MFVHELLPVTGAYLSALLPHFLSSFLTAVFSSFQNYKCGLCDDLKSIGDFYSMPNQCGALILFFFKRSDRLSFLPMMILGGSQNIPVKLLQDVYIGIFANNAHSLCIKPSK